VSSNVDFEVYDFDTQKLIGAGQAPVDNKKTCSMVWVEMSISPEFRNYGEGELFLEHVTVVMARDEVVKKLKTSQGSFIYQGRITVKITNVQNNILNSAKFYSINICIFLCVFTFLIS
jgi:hypothetical protein